MGAIVKEIGAINPVGRSFGLVKDELDSALNQTESLFQRVSDDQSAENLQAFERSVDQVRGIFKLIELPGAEYLTTQMLAVISLFQDANQKLAASKADKAIESLGNAVLSLQQYMAFVAKENKDVPLLLLSVINELRRLQGEKPVVEADFIELNVPNSFPMLEAEQEVEAKGLNRLRHMYQVGLVNVIRSQNVESSLKIMSRGLEGFEKASRGAPSWALWWVASMTANAMAEEKYGLTHDRKLVLGGLDREMRTALKSGLDSLPLNNQLFKSLSYFAAISSIDTDDMNRFKGMIEQTMPFTEVQLKAYRQSLSGPDQAALNSVLTAIREEINQVKETVDILARSDLNASSNVKQINRSIQVMKDTFSMVMQTEFSELAKRAESDMMSFETLSESEQHAALTNVAGVMIELETRIDEIINGTQTKLDSAHSVVIEEIKSGLATAKRAISSYEDSGYDKMHLANISSSLLSIKGGLTFISQPLSTAIIENANRYIKERLIPSDLKPNVDHLECLADAITSVEYYFEMLADTGVSQEEILKVAQESLEQIGMPVKL